MGAKRRCLRLQMQGGAEASEDGSDGSEEMWLEVADRARSLTCTLRLLVSAAPYSLHTTPIRNILHYHLSLYVLPNSECPRERICTRACDTCDSWLQLRHRSPAQLSTGHPAPVTPVHPQLVLLLVACITSDHPLESLGHGR
jgi:hypothetical protein